MIGKMGEIFDCGSGEHPLILEETLEKHHINPQLWNDHRLANNPI